MLIEWLTPDFNFENDAGRLIQLVRDGWKQINVILSHAGSTRGGHFHKYNTECFYIIEGHFTLTVWKDEKKETYELSPGKMFRVPAFVFHTFKYHEDTILISMYDRGVELSETEKDIWTEE